MVYYLSFIFKYLKSLLSKPYKYLTILFFIWLYRVDFIPADGGGMAKVLQVVTIFGMLLLLIRKRNNIVLYSYCKTNYSVVSLLLLYSFALLSTFWAFIPTFAFFLSFQNIVLILFLIWLFSTIQDFKSMEKCFLAFIMLIILFETILYRVIVQSTIFIHYLPSASSAAMCFSYCISEYLSMKYRDTERKRYLKWCMIVSIAVLLTSTSSGANTSAAFGFAIGLFLSGKIIYALLLVGVGIFLYLNQDLILHLLLFIMPGKDIDELQSVTGRRELWNTMIALANQKPIFGWGFACIERAATVFGDKSSPDAHNNFLGMYGSLGYIGLVLFIYHYIVNTLYIFRRKTRIGFLGLLAASCCSMLNGYSFGFMSGKGCSITVIYFSLVILSFAYGKCRYYTK